MRRAAQGQREQFKIQDCRSIRRRATGLEGIFFQETFQDLEWLTLLCLHTGRGWGYRPKVTHKVNDTLES